MSFSFSQSLFDLAPQSHRAPAFLFQKPQAVPQPDDLSLFTGVHVLWEHKVNILTSRYG
jgi:hypothetical protein